MIKILYEDMDLIVVEKPIGIESQSSHSFEPDMVSEIKKHIHKICTNGKEPYVGVIHRLDKPVGGIMVYAKNQLSATALSKQVQNGTMKKTYQAVICGKPVDNVGNYADFLLKNGKTNYSQVVDKGTKGAKFAELNYRVLESITDETDLTLVEIELLTGRHHQIRVQFAAHGYPIWGDNKYNPQFSEFQYGRNVSLALCACKLSLLHPKSGKRMAFSGNPQGDIFEKFNQ